MRLYKALGLSSVIAAVVVAAPFISTFMAVAIADAYGCELNEGVASTCIVAGSDVGRTLYNMGAAFWFFIFSFLFVPVAISLAVAAVIVCIRDRSGKYKVIRVGVIFWLLLFAALLFPLFTYFSLLLTMCTGVLHLWKRRKLSH